MLDDPEAVEAEIAAAVDGAVAFLDQIDTIDAVINHIRADPHDLMPERKIAVLQELQSTQRL